MVEARVIVRKEREKEKKGKRHERLAQKRVRDSQFQYSKHLEETVYVQPDMTAWI